MGEQRVVAESDNERIALAMFAAVNDGRFDDYLVHIADDIVYEAPYFDTMAPRHGRAEVAAMLDGVGSRFGELDYRVVDLIAASDPDLVIAEVQGDHLTLSTGRRYQNHYLNLIRFRDGKVVHWREFSNPDAFRRAFATE